MWHEPFAESELFVKVFLIEVGRLPGKRVQHELILLLGDLDARYPGATFGQLNVFSGISAVIKPEFDFILIQIEAYCHCTRGRSLEAGQVLSARYWVVDTEFYRSTMIFSNYSMGRF